MSMSCNFKFDCLHAPLKKCFYHLGTKVATHPYIFLIMPLLATAILTTGLSQLQLETNLDYLYTPANSQAWGDRLRIEQLFPSTGDKFHGLRQVTPGRFGRVIVTAVDNGDVLRKDVLSEIIRLDSFIISINASDEGETFQFGDVCGKMNNICNPNAILNIYNFDPYNVGNINVTYPMHRLGSTMQVFLGATLGGVTLLSDGTTVKSAKALQLFYLLKHFTDDEERKSKVWELTFLNMMEDYETENIDISYFISQTKDIEVKKSVRNQTPKFVITVVFMVVFCVVSFFVFDWVRSKLWLALLGLFATGMAIGSSIGLMAYCGLPFANLVQSMPFLILGVGVDDMFILVSAWRMTSPKKSVTDRMGVAYSEAALSVTITSITDVLALSVGTTSVFPSARIFCLYTGVAILLAYIYQITFFGACMALSGQREAACRHSVTCMKVKPKSESTSSMYKMFCAGESYQSDNNEHIMTRFFRDYYGVFITELPVKTMTLLLFVSYLTLAVWMSFRMEESFDFNDCFSDDSYAIQFSNIDKKYFNNFGPAVAIVIDDEIDYSTEQTQTAIAMTIEELETSEYYHGNKNITQSWLRAFLDTFPSYNNNMQFVQELRESFLISKSTPFKLDINFNSDNTNVTSSRFYVFSKYIDSAGRAREMLAETRRIVEHSEIKILAYHPAFIYYEAKIVLVPSILKMIGISCLAIFLISLFLIPDPLSALLVTSSIITIILGVVGYMSLWGVHMNDITSMALLIAIGFSVDYTTHIVYAYTVEKDVNHDVRAREALGRLGWPILQGAMSTLISVFSLSMSNSYLFRTLFKSNFLVIIFGALHGLLFLPVTLTVIGSFGRKYDRIV
ncbi:patched domain-containing protein 3-like [Glandiceps talaboti]